MNFYLMQNYLHLIAVIKYLFNIIYFLIYLTFFKFLIKNNISNKKFYY